MIYVLGYKLSFSYIFPLVTILTFKHQQTIFNLLYAFFRNVFFSIRRLI